MMAGDSSQVQAPTETSGFWSRARMSFYSTLIQQKHGELLHTANTIPKAPSESAEDELAADNGPSGLRQDRFVSEQSEYSQSMRDSWLQILHEEITLLKAERQNDLLAKAQDHSPRSSSKGPVWENLPTASPPPIATGTKNRASPSIARVVSVRTVRTLPPVPRPTSEHLPRGSIVMRKWGPLLGNGGLKSSAIVLQRTPSDVKILINGLEASATGSNKENESKMRGGSNKENDTPWGKRMSRRKRAKSGIPRGVEKLEGGSEWRGPASLAQRKAQRAVLERKDSGISAATAAAEAAHVGGKRIRSMWSRMKSALGGRSKDKSGPQKPDMDALSVAVREGELPPQMRGSAWLALALQDAQDIADARMRYKSFSAQRLDQEPEIQRDVHRTFPDHPLFEEEGGPGQRALLNLMRAYAAYDTEVGYCQGMGFLGAVLLMHIGEADAFAVLLHLLYRCGFRATFLPDMEQLQARMYQLTQLVQEALPELDAHMEELGIRPVMYAAPWFLTIFASTLPLPLIVWVFDVILAERSSAFVFKTALVLLQVSLRQLLQCPEAEHFVHFLRTELSAQLGSLSVSDLEEIRAKALRVHLPFESMLRLEAEYELLAEEAATAANEVDAAADASRAAAEAWEKARAELETRLALALQAQARAEGQLADVLERRGGLDERNGEVPKLGGEADGTGVLRGPNTAGSHTPVAPGGVRMIKSRADSDALSSGDELDDDRAVSAPSAVLLRKVMAFRQEKQSIDAALKRAERALQRRVRQENHRLENGGPEGQSDQPRHFRRASWTAR